MKLVRKGIRCGYFSCDWESDCYPTDEFEEYLSHLRLDHGVPMYLKGRTVRKE